MTKSVENTNELNFFSVTADVIIEWTKIMLLAIGMLAVMYTLQYAAVQFFDGGAVPNFSHQVSYKTSQLTHWVDDHILILIGVLILLGYLTY